MGEIKQNYVVVILAEYYGNKYIAITLAKRKDNFCNNFTLINRIIN